VLTGLFFGDDAALLRPLGTVYVRLMEVVVFPYIICSLLHGLGRLTPDTAWRLLRCSWRIYAVAWGATLCVIFGLSLGIPSVPSPSFIDASAPAREFSLLSMLIPANPFFDLVRNYVPAVVVLSIVYGIAIQRVNDKGAFLSMLTVVREASVKIWGWVVMLAPVGVFALFADSAGSLRTDALVDLALYLLPMIAGTLLLAFWLLPSLVAALCPLRAGEVLRELRAGLVIAVVTSLSVAALPFIQQAAERLADRLEIRDQDRGEIIKTSLAVSYPLAQLGNFFIWLFVLFGAYYYRVPIDADDQVALPFVSLLSGIGSPSSSIDSVAFLSEWLALPTHSTDVYVGMMVITRYGQVLASVMGFGFITILTTLAYYGKLRLSVPRLLVALAVGGAIVAAVTTAGRLIHERFARPAVNELTFELPPDITDLVSVLIEKPGETSASPSAAGAGASDSSLPMLARIQKEGVLRVGYNPDIIPFAYMNEADHLVGFDVAYAYRLAADLDVDLHLIPFTWQGLDADLEAGRFHLAASGIYVTDERLRRFAISEPYFRSPVAFIVRSDVVDHYLSRATISALPHPAIAVFDDPVIIQLAAALFPDIDVVRLPSYDALPRHPEVEAVLWTREQARAWARPRVGYTAVEPTDIGGPLLFGYVMPPDAVDLRQFVDYWMRLQRANGFHDRLVDRWIHGKPDPVQTPRWSIARDVLGWGKASALTQSP
jgi:Na+/H+-dicarboxylate symporter/ABC-type amino acid transport substrate-binding protein